MSVIRRIIYDEARDKKSLFSSFLKKTRISSCELNIRFIDNRAMKRENRRIFRRNGLTDVIAFSSVEGERFVNENTLGDMIINAQIAREECGRFRHSFRTELLLLVIHGTLHILGYDHQKEKAPMRRKERAYLNLTQRKRGVPVHA